MMDAPRDNNKKEVTNFPENQVKRQNFINLKEDSSSNESMMDQ